MEVNVFETDFHVFAVLEGSAFKRYILFCFNGRLDIFWTSHVFRFTLNPHDVRAAAGKLDGLEVGLVAVSVDDNGPNKY